MLSQKNRGPVIDCQQIRKERVSHMRGQLGQEEGQTKKEKLNNFWTSRISVLHHLFFFSLQPVPIGPYRIPTHSIHRDFIPCFFHFVLFVGYKGYS